MLKELGKADWLQRLKLSAAHIPTVLILRGTHNLQAQYGIARGFFSHVQEVGAPNGLIEYAFTGELRGRRGPILQVRWSAGDGFRGAPLFGDVHAVWRSFFP